jgi:light-regulated signal transduction histidine kinase (bacteriophytochrome)
MSQDKTHPDVRLLDEAQQFLQSAVHDLRAAQRRTSIAAELLIETSSDEKRIELVEQMLQGLSKTEELLTGIGKYATALKMIDESVSIFPLGSSVRFAVANLDREIQRTGATVKVGDLPEIPGDRDRLAELFEHLIGNSLKFRGPDPPAVEIASSRVPEGWRFSVTDNGIGIAAKYRSRLFIPFRRLHGAEVPGTGLGLAISKKIVEAHGGRIWIEAQEKPGVTFCFNLPAADGD